MKYHQILTRKKSAFKLGYLMLLPAVILLVATQIYPFLYGIGMSFTNYNLLSMHKPKFIGLDNFVKIVTKDKVFYPMLTFSFIYTMSIVLFSYLFGLMFAILLNHPIRMRGFFRAATLLPWIISSMVMAINWLWLMNDKYGFINRTLLDFHLIKEPILFFVKPEMARFSVIVIGIWRNIPFMAITLLAGLQGIPNDLYESATIDGANPLQAFFAITLPMLKSVTLMSTTLMFIWAFNGFENIYLLTEGGPVNSTMVIPVYAYQTAFNKSQMGYSSALSVLLLAIMLIFGMIRFKLNKQDI
ncbi:sugar ABC transporter permease [uncultured Sphaerochaeta sp.]|uniref:carbohydrate ABC transporter permease n=1 Tax=uncultured Sphaerochaeta sp. TaxID=886478 RepID=UPI002A0A5C48|nr:sugar ABC transporter permease [uncultured Sphaerochaeta sp.]